MVVSADEVINQANCIIDSQTLRSSEALRKLLRYLAERSNSADADQLKEYVVGVEALHKPPEYDPREDSTVRIQVGRLRQKLAEYYQSEGKHDTIVAELPKGHFKLIWSRHPSVAQSTSNERRIPRYAISLIVSLIGCLAWASLETVQLHDIRAGVVSSQSLWTPELKDLWAPFITSNRPLFIVVSAPMFVKLGENLVRDMGINRPEDIPRSKMVSPLMKALNLNTVTPDFRYTNFGNLTSIFLLGRLLGSRNIQLSIINSREVNWQQMSEANILFVGASRFFVQQSQIPIQQPLILETDVGVRNMHPQPGEESSYRDNVTPDGFNGITYSLVSRMPGPLGSGDIETFAGSTAAGIQAAVRWFTTPASAGVLDKALKGRSGGLPPYFQVLLSVTCQGNVPINTSYVLSRVLEPNPAYEPLTTRDQ